MAGFAALGADRSECGWREKWRFRTRLEVLHEEILGGVATGAMLEAAKSLLLVLNALFPIVDPLGGSPFFLALTGVRAGGAKSIVMANCHEQFRPAGGIVFCWDLHSGVLRDFVAGGAGRWRVDRRRDGMDVAEAKGR